MSLKSTTLSYIIVTTSLILRIYKLETNIYIKWDESHTLNYAKHYLNGTFHLDVHPPLGKILISYLAKHCYLNLETDYKSGRLFPKEFNWLILKQINAFIGGLIPYITFKALRILISNESAFYVALLLVFENFFIFLSRLIILDNLFLLSNVCAIYYYLKKGSYFLLGLFLGLTISIKLCGVFTYLCVCMLSFHRLAFKKCTRKLALKCFATLVIIPVNIYVLSFGLHFYLLTKPSNDLTIMSSEFVSRFYDYNIYLNSISPLSIKNESGRIIHFYKYPSISQSNITDSKPLACANSYYSENSKIRLVSKRNQRIKNGDYIAIYFQVNNSFLSVDNEVTGLQELTKGSIFQILTKGNKLVINYKTKVSLYNPRRKCYLNISDELRHGSPILKCTEKVSFWTFEQPNFMNPKPFSKFISSFIETNLKMLSLNNSLNQSNHSYASKAKTWLFNRQGIQFKLPNSQYLLIGNTLTWYLTSVFILTTITFNHKIFVLLFLFNYLPYLAMNRTLYLHNYIPAYLYGIMCAGGLFKRFKFTRFLVVLTTINFFRTRKFVYGD